MQGRMIKWYALGLGTYYLEDWSWLSYSLCFHTGSSVIMIGFFGAQVHARMFYKLLTLA